jgi:hypothetical protein
VGIWEAYRIIKNEIEMKKMVAVGFFILGIVFMSKAQIVDSLKVKIIDSTAISTADSAVAPAISKSLGKASCATLYVYRPKSFVGSAIGYDLHLGDSIVCRVKNNTKFEIPLTQEGKVEVWAKTEAKRSVVLDVKPGVKYYIRCSVSMGIVAGRPDIIQVMPEQGVVEYDKVEGRKK